MSAMLDHFNDNTGFVSATSVCHASEGYQQFCPVESRNVFDGFWVELYIVVWACVNLSQQVCKRFRVYLWWWFTANNWCAMDAVDSIQIREFLEYLVRLLVLIVS